MDLAPSSTSLNPLTVREREVATLVARGLEQGDIADELGIAVGTVNALTKRAASKLPGEGRPIVKIARFSHLIAASDSA